MGNHQWTPQEIKKVIDNFQIAPDFYLVRLLPGRTPLAIAALRRRLNLKYTQEWMNGEMKKNRLSTYVIC